jgi:hypothetical protein
MLRQMRRRVRRPSIPHVRPHGRCRGHPDEQGPDRRWIPERHRPDRRSSSSASTALAPGVSRGGGVRNSSIGTTPVPTRTIPARSSRRSRPVGSGGECIGSSIATGRPRSVMTTLSPLRTRSINALRPFFASVIVAVFIWPFWPVWCCREPITRIVILPVSGMSPRRVHACSTSRDQSGRERGRVSRAQDQTERRRMT